MTEKYKIAIIGNKETIIGFKALGLTPFNANTSEEALDQLHKVIKEQITTDEKTEETRPAYAIIFITEDLAMNIPEEEYSKLNQGALPAIIPIPGSTGTTGYGLKRIGKMVEQAIGSDIFGDN